MSKPIAMDDDVSVLDLECEEMDSAIPDPHTMLDRIQFQKLMDLLWSNRKNGKGLLIRMSQKTNRRYTMDRPHQPQQLPKINKQLLDSTQKESFQIKLNNKNGIFQQILAEFGTT